MREILLSIQKTDRTFEVLGKASPVRKLFLGLGPIHKTIIYFRFWPKQAGMPTE
jgi:hypothetical protein